MATKMGREQPPPARPNPENCRHCGVRHLCTEYWATLSTWRKGGDVVDEFGDVEVIVESTRGPRSWDGVLITSAWLPRQSRVVLTTTGDPMVTGVASGMRARLLNVRLLQSGEIDVPLVCVSTYSEVFRSG